MILTEQHIIKPAHKFYKEIDNLCFLSKNLYNTGLYEIRQHFFKSQYDNSIKYKYLNYFELNKKLKNEKNKDYNILPIQTSQQILRIIDQNFKSFFILLKKKKLKEYSEKINIPKYLKKNGRFIVKYSIQNISKKYLNNNIIKIPKTNIEFRTKVENIKEIRFIPKSNYIIFEITYEKTEKQIKNNNDRYLSIDLGINNLATCTSNKIKSFIINGRPIKSINQYYNKKLSQLQSELSNKNLNTSKRIQKLTLKRNSKIKDYFHKTSRYIVNQAVYHSLNTIIVGYNKGWKQETNIGKINNQKFQQISFAQLVNMLSYKAKLVGINILIQNESYTSKCSFFDNEPIKKHDNYLGKRIKRGLFKTSTGLLINADINGSLNILRKKINEANDEILSPVCRGLVLNPLRIKTFL